MICMNAFLKSQLYNIAGLNPNCRELGGTQKWKFFGISHVTHFSILSDFKVYFYSVLSYTIVVWLDFDLKLDLTLNFKKTK